MKKSIFVFLVMTISACDSSTMEEYAFRKTMESSLTETCGEQDKACAAAVKSQLKGCMEKSKWRQYLNNSEDQAELQRFTKALYGCIVDETGKPYFVAHVK